MSRNLKPLFIFELANNHNGSVERGVKIISEIKEQTKDYEQYFDFAFKLQYRNLDTFIHPEYKNRTDIPFIKRFYETMLSNEELLTLKTEFVNQGFIPICTAFDEESVDLIEEHGYEFIKIASCSFSDWTLLEKIATKNMPIIASTAGISLENIDKVVRFFAGKWKELSLLHCVAEYPTKLENLQLNQIDLLKKTYPNLIIGYSSHEHSSNIEAIKLAVAKSATIFEKHVGLDDYEGSINDYSITPKQVGQWLKYAKEAFDLCGTTQRYSVTQAEADCLQKLSRGLFAKTHIKNGEKISRENTFMAIPSFENQLMPSEFSKDDELIAQSDINANAPIFNSDVT